MYDECCDMGGICMKHTRRLANFHARLVGLAPPPFKISINRFSYGAQPATSRITPRINLTRVFLVLPSYYSNITHSITEGTIAISTRSTIDAALSCVRFQ
jgi:hypothetical protein